MRTDLYEHHVALGAKMVNFSGWLMPIQYEGIIPEHRAVREKAGIFDVSHMGRILIEGPEAESFLDWLSTNTIAGKKEGTAIYTAWCREDGGTVDDLIVYKQNSSHFFVIVNASNRDKDLEHLIHEGGRFDVLVRDAYADEGILAIQGPEAYSHVVKLFPEAEKLKPFRFCTTEFDGQEIFLAQTGYTGAGGYELAGPKEAIRSLWEEFIEQGVAPIGLGARDTLRLEMGYALYGHELSETIAPTESVSAWAVKMDKPAFLGKQALARYHRRQYGIRLTGKGIAREGYPVFQGSEQIGTVTSGTMSPTLGKAIALVMVDRDLNTGDSMEVEIRGKRVPAEMTNIPFIQNQESKK